MRSLLKSSLFFALDALVWLWLSVGPVGALLGALSFYLCHRCWWHPEHYEYDLVEV